MSQLLTSIKQCPTPLNNLFFSDFNQALLQRGIREKVYQMYKIKIDYQDKDDLIALMRVIFIANYSNPYGDLCSQVQFINTKVIERATEQISTGLSQYYGYINDINSPITPPDIPLNTSTYGLDPESKTRTIGF
jgi:hypothetical protein